MKYSWTKHTELVVCFIIFSMPNSVLSSESLLMQEGNVIPIIMVLLALLIALLSRIQVARLRARVLKENEIEKQAFEKYRLMFEHADEGIVLVQNLKIKYVNIRIFEIMGLSKEIKISRNLVDYIHADDLEIIIDSFEKNVSVADNDEIIMVRVLKPDSSWFWARVRIVRVLWDGKPSILAFMRDISHQKMLENDLQQAQRMEAIGALSGGIAHDFNNILTMIIGNAEIALMDIAQGEPGRSECDQIRNAGYRARDLVRQILSISREQQQDIQLMHLSSVIKEAVKLLKSTLPSNIRITEKIDPDLNMVKADSSQMYQVFMNLCTNAKDAMEEIEYGHLTIELANTTLYMGDKMVCNALKPGAYVRLAISDNGTGVADELKDKIFEPYFTTKDGVNETGLGLATTMGIVRQFGGHICCDSELGKGSCFAVYLPSFEEKKKEQYPPEKVVEKTNQGRILFADDEKPITMVAKKMFEHFGFKILTAGSGTEAFEQFSRTPDDFDLLITDLDMPGMTGEELVSKVLLIRPDFPVIICSGYFDRLNGEKARSAHALEYIRKPYNLKKLTATAAKYIKSVKAA